MLSQTKPVPAYSFFQGQWRDFADRRRIMADSLVYYVASETLRGEMPLEYPVIPWSIKHSKDGVTDTVVQSGRILVLGYSESDQLLSIKNLYPIREGESPTRGGKSDGKWIVVLEAEFEYDAQGRITKEIDYWQPQRSFEHDYSTMVETDNGFIFEGLEYVFDSEGRLVQTKSTDPNNPYGVTSYTYFENGYEVKRRGAYSTTYPEHIDLSYKDVYYFQEDGYLSRSYTFVERNDLTYERYGAYAEPYFPDEKEWLVIRIAEAEYYHHYNLDYYPQKASDAATGQQVFGTNGAIVIQTDNPLPVSVYAVTGQLIKQTVAGAGSTTVPVPKGWYVVAAGMETYKVLIW
ncbi:MAG: DUF6383 domain-containing protein [Tannerella sp.]|nr:DUF6383 domain-containing protein [Tannerella sp.]